MKPRSLPMMDALPPRQDPVGTVQEMVAVLP